MTIVFCFLIYFNNYDALDIIISVTSSLANSGLTLLESYNNLSLYFLLISIIGDLIESYFKRKNNIKDSSQFLPGHGGYFDRFDSFIASIIFLTIFSLI